MQAMVFTGVGNPLELTEVPMPIAGEEQVLIQIEACGVCRTDLHITEGDLSATHLPLILGHQIVGIVKQIGAKVTTLSVGMRVGVPWLGKTCGHCFYCHAKQENLCDAAQFTGYHLNGGYAQYCVAHHRYCFLLNKQEPASSLAPLLCAGLIGYRALRLAGSFKTIGFYGFGSSAHLLTQVVSKQGGQVYAFTKPQDKKKQDFARSLGAVWAAGSDQAPDKQLDAAIIFASAGPLVIQALKTVHKGATVVCAGIHMSPIPSFSYNLLWEERCIRSVANLTREDGSLFLQLAEQLNIKTQVTCYSLSEANEALADLKAGRLQGSAVLIPK